MNYLKHTYMYESVLLRKPETVYIMRTKKLESLTKLKI